MVHFEVVLRPNFKSPDHYQVLGCHPSSSKEELTEAYRNLSWKYHPQNRPDDAEAMQIFVRLSEAYCALVVGDIESGGRKRQALTASEAKRAYEKRFGRFTRLYYNEGGIVGLPYAFALKEILSTEEGPRRLLEFGRLRVAFFRGFRLKLKLDWIVAIIEVLLTWGTVAACVLYCLSVDESYDWYINLIGGAGILLSSCLLSFWYGFTRYPMLLENDYASWLRGKDHRKDMDDIRDVCSEFYHCVDSPRRGTLALMAFAPILAVDQLTSCISVVILSLFLIPVRLTVGISSQMETYFWGLAKSIGALMSAVGYYSAWVLGDDIIKCTIVALLLVNQALYTSILCRMSTLEFLWSVIFRGVVFVGLTERKVADESVKFDIEVDHEPTMEGWSDEETKKDRSLLSAEGDEGTNDGQNNVQVGPKSDGGSTKASSTSSQGDGGVITGCDTFASLALPGSRGAKSIDFTGEIYSARLGDQSETESNSLADTISSLPAIFQDFKKKIETGIMAAMAPMTPAKRSQDDIPTFVRSGTELSSLSRDQSSLQMSAITEDPGFAKLRDFGTSLDIQASRKTETAEAASTLIDDDEQESLAIVGDIESSRDLTNFRDPRVTENAPPPEALNTSEKSDLENISILPSLEEGPVPGGNVFEATTEDIHEKEAPPPSSVLKTRKVQRSSILEIFCAPDENSVVSGQALKEKAARSRNSSQAETHSKPGESNEMPVIQVPEHVDMIRMATSVDEEDLTVTGFDVPQSPDRGNRRGRRPAPGKVDLPLEQQFVF